uniref:Uncharacterized protein n=1 Tax=Arundo donax TaxID=35708 RepID=A0A0A9C903_ARUDO
MDYSVSMKFLFCFSLKSKLLFLKQW